MYLYNLTTTSWSLTLVEGVAPEARFYHGLTSTYTGTSKAAVFMHGGFNEYGEQPAETISAQNVTSLT
jgi:hypothetical protein